MVCSAHILDLAIATPARDISRAIETRHCARAKGVWKKPLGCQLWTIQVATRQSVAAYIEFARDSYGNRLEPFIEQIDLRVRQRAGQ